MSSGVALRFLYSAIGFVYMFNSRSDNENDFWRDRRMSRHGCQRSFESLVFAEVKSAGTLAGVVVDFCVLLVSIQSSFIYA